MREPTVSGIFISHSSRDREAAADMAARLRARGYPSLFLDFDPADGIPAGRDWERELYARLRALRPRIRMSASIRAALVSRRLMHAYDQELSRHGLVAAAGFSCGPDTQAGADVRIR